MTESDTTRKKNHTNINVVLRREHKARLQGLVEGSGASTLNAVMTAFATSATPEEIATIVARAQAAGLVRAVNHQAAALEVLRDASADEVAEVLAEVRRRRAGV